MLPLNTANHVRLVIMVKMQLKAQAIFEKHSAWFHSLFTKQALLSRAPIQMTVSFLTSKDTASP
ncbi:hypothetical protein SAMN05421754_104311 [Nitrosomonas sp. Nm58]|nr:hypothetical protein SAMN05421754_104311 [Nitrosomonas sp. Nm58]